MHGAPGILLGHHRGSKHHREQAAQLAAVAKGQRGQQALGPVQRSAKLSHGFGRHVRGRVGQHGQQSRVQDQHQQGQQPGFDPKQGPTPQFADFYTGKGEHQGMDGHGTTSCFRQRVAHKSAGDCTAAMKASSKSRRPTSRSATGPWATTRPRCRMATRSHTCSTSCNR